MQNLYRESQKFNQWWVWLLMFFALGIGLWGGYSAYMGSGDWMGVIIAGGVSILTLISFALLELRTSVTEDGIEVSLWPFSKKRIFRSEIASAEVRKYSPIKEYGGWGYRIGASGIAYNVMGNMGLQLTLTNGKRILIGTQRPEELQEVMDHYLGEGYELSDPENLELKTLQKEQAKRRL